jgi:hypothetical protein
VPALEKGNRDEDDNRLPAVANLDLKNPGVSVLKLPSALRLFDIQPGPVVRSAMVSDNDGALDRLE